MGEIVEPRIRILGTSDAGKLEKELCSVPGHGVGSGLIQNCEERKEK